MLKSWIFDIEMDYSDVHRSFLQAVSNKGSVSSRDALSLLVDAQMDYGSEDDRPIDDKSLRQMVGEINSKLYALEQTLNFVYFDNNGEEEEHLVFVSSNLSGNVK